MCLWSVEIGFLWRGKKKEPRKWIDAINLTMAVYEYCTDSFAVFHSEDVAGESDIDHANALHPAAEHLLHDSDLLQEPLRGALAFQKVLLLLGVQGKGGCHPEAELDRIMNVLNFVIRHKLPVEHHRLGGQELNIKPSVRPFAPERGIASHRPGNLARIRLVFQYLHLVSKQAGLVYVKRMASVTTTTATG